MAKQMEESSKQNLPAGGSPFHALRANIDRLFDQFTSRPFGGGLFETGPGSSLASGMSFQMPSVSFAETDKAFEITAELPGMDKENVDINVANGVLTLSGEKREEKEDKEKDFYLSERSYGIFRRSFRLPDGVEEDSISADFKNGVLKITLPKREPGKSAKNGKKIEIS